MPNIEPSLLRRVAAEAVAHQSHPPATLYMVATPIGNLADLSLRAVHVLGLVDLVACEDTRVASRLLSHLGLDKPLLALHAHNENAAAETVCSRLAGGASVACLSDAGTPGVSDPGARLVAVATRAGHRVVPLPGASSALAALSVAGDVHSSGFRFVGFLPAKGNERRLAVQAVTADPGTQVLFEAPHRIESLVEAVAQAVPTRRITLARELTKQFEEVASMPAAEAPAWLAGDVHRRRGEFVLVLHAVLPAAVDAEALSPDARRCLSILLRELPLKQAVGLAAEISAAPRNALYELALRWRDHGGGG